MFSLWSASRPLFFGNHGASDDTVHYFSQAHAQCSESFYRKELESNIRTEPSKTAEERMRMMELLKRFERSADGDDAGLLEEDEEAGDDGTTLAKRLDGIDLGKYNFVSKWMSGLNDNAESASSDDLWLTLTQEERSRFLKALDDPSSELAQQLLASEELERTKQYPWWDAPVVSDDAPASQFKRYGMKPEVISIPSNAVKPLSGPSLVYNLCAVW
jgi:hypothetical protein